MATWTGDELSRIDAADELRIAPLRRDGTLRDPVTIWVARHGDDLYVRSINGADAAWFRGTQAQHEGHIAAGGVEKDVAFEAAGGELDEELDAAYRDKYRRYARNIVDSVLTPAARSTTLKLVPRG